MAEASIKSLNSNIDILDENFKYQEENFPKRDQLMIGESSLATGYHADLILTLRHDAEVLSLCFSPNSEYYIFASSFKELLIVC